MKERLSLFLILVCLGIFLYIFQNHFNTLWGFVFFACVTLIYGFYMNLATKHRMRKIFMLKNPPAANENYKPFVTIMVPAHNEACVITDTVENILKLDYEAFELIVIDDRSEDATAEVIKLLEQKHDKVTALVREQDAFPGKSAVLNDAMQLARGEAVLVFDADARVEPDFLTKLVSNLEPEDVGAVQARKVVSNKDCNFLTRCQNNEMTFDTYIQIGRDAIHGAVELRGNGELIKRSALEDIGGWNNFTITDDLDMSTRLHIKGWDVRFCKDAIVYEEGIVHLMPIFRQRRRWVEGSIRRYLEFFGNVVFSKDMSMRAKLDMTAYISQFLLPVLISMEIIVRMCKFATGETPPNDLLSMMAAASAVGLFFFLAIRHSLRKYDGFSRWQAFVQAVETTVYFLIIWVPTAIFVLFKILFREKSMTWGKTAHGVVQTKH